MTNTFSRQEIIDYAKSKGYSPRAINQVLNESKNEIVDYAINSGYKGSTINKVLKEYGYDNYNPWTSKANWQNLLPNIAKGAEDIARDMRTIGGVVLQPFVDVTNTPMGYKTEKLKENFINAINNDALRRTAIGAGAGAAIGSKLGLLGTAGGLLGGGILGMMGPEGFANAQLMPYETSTKDIGQAIKGKKKWSDVGADIAQGALRNPLYAGIDFLSLGGAKALGGAGRMAGRAIPADAPLAVQQIIQSPAMRDFSRNATNAFQVSKARNAEYMEPLEQLGSTFGIDNKALAEYIMTNEGGLTGKQLEVGQNIKKSIRGLEEKLSEYGFLDKNASRTNVVAQYGMQKLQGYIPDIIHRDLVEYLETNKMTPRIAEAVLKNPDVKTILDNTLTEGKRLYDSGDTAWLTQALVGTTDPRGEVVARATAKIGHGYFGTRREIGRATAEDFSKANILEDSLAHQQAQSVRAVEAMDVMDDILKQPGLVEEIKDINNIPKGKTVINMKELKDNLRDAIQQGADIDVANVLSKSKTPELGAYLIPNVYFEALNNMFKPVYKGTGKDIMNAFKKTVLASPHWFALNRIGNWTNNSMGGIEPWDYKDAVTNWNIMPKALKAQTSFGAYVGDSAMGLSSAITTPAKNLVKEVKRLADSDKSLSDIGRFVGQTWTNTSNIFSNPMFRFEAAAEATDRFANFIRQAKREGKATKTDWKEIVKKADKDATLFNKLNTQVNKDLGDYVGRNYLMDNTAYEILNAAVPFYRFLTQTGRTSFHQLANHGIPFQATVMAPAKAGRQFSEQIMQQYGLDPNKYEGGVPYATDIEGKPRFIGTEPLPFGAVASDLLGSGNKLSLLAPGYTTLPNVLAYKTNFGTLPSSPGLTQYKLEHFGSDKGYEPTNKDRLGYALNQLLNTYYAPSRIGTGWGRELSNALLGRPTLSLYDANMMKVNPESYAKEMPIETIGKWFGIQNRKYPVQYIERKKKPSKSQVRKARQLQGKIEYNRQLLER